jgi:hypothetical protein
VDNKEIWKDVKGYEGLYQVSNLGRVKSFREGSKFGKQKEYILKPWLINSGYHVVMLYKEDRSKRKYQLHRLVAETFIPNPENLPCVNHKDENKINNEVSNLEWCTYSYNNNYGTARERALKTRIKSIQQQRMDGKVIAAYCSVDVACGLLGYDKDTLEEWCRIGVGGGYLWRYSCAKMGGI